MAWLIRQAVELTGQGREQPRNADLRRATSAAYYALFHQVALDVSRHFVPGGSSDEHRQMARNVGHTSIRQVCAWIGGDTPPKHIVDVVRRLRSDAVVTSVAAAFTKLHDWREVADYDHFGNVTRPDTRVLVRQARRTVDLLRRHGAATAVRTFLGLIALQTSLR